MYFDGSWDEATHRAGGYGFGEILWPVLAATLHVVQGSAVHERDSVTFDRITYAWPLLPNLVWFQGRSQKLSVSAVRSTRSADSKAAKRRLVVSERLSSRSVLRRTVVPSC